MPADDWQGMLAGGGTRALLVSSGSYLPGSRLGPVPASAASVTDLGRCLVERAGLDPGHLEILADPATPQAFSSALGEAAGLATDVLFFWYAGHGLVSAAQELHLATRATADLTRGVPEYQALPYSTVKGILKQCRARLVVVGLDCCYSGRADGWSARNGDVPLEATRQHGVYVLAAGGRDDAALAPPGRYTAFTGAVIGLLTDGDAAAPAWLTLDDVYQCLARALPRRGLPRPRRFAADEGDCLPLAPNPAYRRPASSEDAGSGAPDRFSPYRGLASFEPDDARFFFGREDLTRALTGLLGEQLTAGCPLVVTGPSGSGKSSVLRAGLIPALQRMQQPAPGRARPPVLFFTPGIDPLGNLIANIADADPVSQGRMREQAQADPGSFAAAVRDAAAAYLAGRDVAREPLVIVVDQFEEIFAPGIGEAQRAAFIDALCAACRPQHQDAGLPALAVLGVRADFFGHCASYPQLVTALQNAVVVGPMTREQLRSAITRPAELAGLVLEDGLTDLLLEDLELTGQSAEGPGATLPLLSHALLVTWQQRQGSRLTLAGYHASGGIARSLAKTADSTLGSLDLASRQIARQLLLRLVQLGEGTEDTRRYAPLSGLLPAHDSPDYAAARHVLEVFVRARLLTADADTVRITHEALLRAWPQLRAWIDTDRASLLASQQLARDAAAWERHGREPAFLYSGSRLVTAQAAAAEQQRTSLTPLEHAFLDASIRRARRHARRTRQLITVLASLVLIAGGLAAYAFQQRHDATSARDQADSREVAAEAEQVRGEDPSLAAQLSLAAYQIDHTPSALATLLESAAYPDAARFQDTAGLVQAVTLTPDHRLLAVAAADGSLRLWDVAQPGHPVPLGTPLEQHTDSPLYTAAFSPDGRLLAAAGAGRTISLWQITDSRHATTLGSLTGPANTVYSVAFSPDGKILAAGSADNTVRLWDITDPHHPTPLGNPITGPAGYVQAVAFSPDGKILAAGSADNTVRLWDIADPHHPAPLGGPLTGPTQTVDAVAFSPSGHILAAGSRDRSVWLWNLASPAHPVRARPPLTGAIGWINAIAFSPGGNTLAAAGGNQVLVWDTATGAWLSALASPQKPTSLAWDNSRTLIAGDAGGTVRLWKLPPPILDAGGTVDGVSYSPASHLLAVAGPDLQLWDPATRTQTAQATRPAATPTVIAWDPRGPLLATGYTDGKLQIWRADPGQLTRLGQPFLATATGQIESVDFRRDGRILATAADDGTVRLWNVADPGRPELLNIIHYPADAYALSATFSPSGSILAATGTDHLTRLWDITDPARPRMLGKPLAGPASYAISVTFSPDGHTLAVGSADKTIRLWDITTPRHPHAIGSPLTGPGGYVYTLAFNPHGTVLAAGSTDGTIWIWNTANPAEPALITHVTDSVSQEGQVFTLAFSPDGNTLAAGNSDGSVRLWNLQPATAAAAICATTGQPLTQAEWDTYIPGRPYTPPCT